ncbi:YALIA101S16e00122g1_1 [Yarrowia lipolytica]|nr:YALIA101S16e00122g1_1 [Yarrowia lipolytica]
MSSNSSQSAIRSDYTQNDVTSSEMTVMSYYLLGPEVGSKLNEVMPHRSIDEWNFWTEYFSSGGIYSKLIQYAGDPLFYERLVKPNLEQLSREYPQWYGRPVGMDPFPSYVESFPFPEWRHPDMIYFMSRFARKTRHYLRYENFLETREIVLEKLEEQYPHFDMHYVENWSWKFEQNAFKLSRAAAKLMAKEGSLREYRKWLERTFPEYYGGPQRVAEIRKVDWYNVENIMKSTGSGKSVIAALSKLLPIQLIKDAFYKTSGLPGPALKYMKHPEEPLPGIWTASDDLDLLEDDEYQVARLRTFHGDHNVKLRQEFLVKRVVKANNDAKSAFERPKMSSPRTHVSPLGEPDVACPTLDQMRLIECFGGYGGEELRRLRMKALSQL